MAELHGTLRFPPFELDPGRSMLRRGSENVEIHATPLRLLIYLVLNRDRTVSKIELLDHVWSDVFVSEAAVSSAMNELRRVLGDSGASQSIIRTERGRGYRFVAEVEYDPGPGHFEPDADRSSLVAVAVLPFADMSSEGDQEYLADGMAEEIINELTHIDGLLVVARTSSFAFKHRDLDIREIGAAMGVAAALEGSVRKQNDRFRVCAQLIRTSDGFHVWSEMFERPLDDLFGAETEIAESVARALEAELVGTNIV